MNKYISAREYISKNIKKNGKTIFVLSVLSVLASFISVAFATVSKNVVDAAVNGTKQQFLNSILITGAVVVIQVVVQVLLSIVSVIAENKIILKNKREFFGEILNKDFLKIKSYHTGDLMSRINTDVHVVYDGVVDIIPVTVSLLSQLIFGFVLLIKYDALYAVIYMASLPVIMLISKVFKKKIKEIHKMVVESEGKIRGNIQENLTNILVVKAFSKEKNKKNLLKLLQKQNYWCIIRKNKLGISVNLLFSLLLTVGYCVTVIWGAYRISTGFYTYGTLVAMIELVSLVQAPMKSFSGIMPQYFSMIASAERILEIKALKDDGEGEAKVDSKALNSNFEKIIIENLEFSYDGQKVLDNYSAEIHKGEFVSLKGQSGIGKSTLMKILLGVLKPDKGNVVVLCSDRQYYIGKETRALFSYVPQGNTIFSGSIKDNITFSEEVEEELLKKAIECACLEEVIKEQELGIDTVIGEDGTGLSEGQNQRIAIARAVYSNTEVVLLDEATSALDEETAHKVIENLKALGKTIIMISHTSEAMYASDITLTLKK